jgi:hypothetical protein
MDQDHEKAITIFKTGHAGIVAIVKSILDEAEIKYVTEGESAQNFFGAGVIGSGFNVVTGPVVFQVMPEDEEYARELLKDIEEFPSEDNSSDEIPEGGKSGK